MKSFHLRVFVALCLCASLNDFVHCSEWSSVYPFHNGLFARKHFLKRRILYSSNCTASFQLELLNAGDVHPNPGPYNYIQHEEVSPTSLRHGTANVHRTIRGKTRRGTRGGRRKNSITRDIKQPGSSSSSSNLQLCSVNVQSVRNKTVLIHDFICDSKVDLVAITETWLNRNDSAVLHELTPNGYQFVHHPRSGRRGGGTGLVFRETIDVRMAAAGVLPRDCKDVQQRGLTSSGTYTIQPDHNGWPFQVYCDMETDGGGWTVFQRRSNSSEQFRRGWASYRRGFGSSDGDFWLGLDRLHRLTFQDEYELRVDMSDFDNIAVHAGYTWFRVDDTASNYRLHVGEYHGIAGDALSYHDGQEFSTKDRDNDSSDTSHCARDSGEGGWWFNQCLKANPNGLYLGGLTEQTREGVVWTTWKGPNYSLKTIELKLRPVAD